MNKVQKMLLIPCISPLLFILLLATFNKDQKSKIRFLIWESNSIKLSSLVTISALSGFTLGTIISSQIGSNVVQSRRKVIINKKVESHVNENNQCSSEVDTINTNQVEELIYHERDLREPKPTVQIPFKIIRKKAATGQFTDINNVNINDIDDTPEEYSPNQELNQVQEDDWQANNIDNW